MKTFLQTIRKTAAFLAILMISTGAFQATPLSAQVETVQKYEWAVVGGGPAGILTLNFLLTNKVPASSIAWIDPEFQVGALGEFYKQVPGNLSTGQWITIMEGCHYLKQCPAQPLEFLKRHDPASFHELNIIVQPLQQITDWLRHDVPSFQNKVVNLQRMDGNWQITLQDTTIQAHKVILATGSHPRSLDYACKNSIDLPTALDKQKLAQSITKDDIVAVVGSSHSAVIALKFLSELPVKHIVHLYNKPFEYTIRTANGIINAETGLKGPAAEFAKNILEDNCPANMTRIFNDERARNALIPHCTKIIYAVGFEQNSLPWAAGQFVSYNDETGVIAEHMYGIGIAFPENKADMVGKIEHRVGMPYFLDYANRVVPQWIQQA